MAKLGESRSNVRFGAKANMIAPAGKRANPANRASRKTVQFSGALRIGQRLTRGSQAAQ